MATENNTSENSNKNPQSQEEIHSLVKNLMGQQSELPSPLENNQPETIPEKTPLDNLKGVLSHIDNAVMSAEKPAVNPNAFATTKPATATNADSKTPSREKIKPDIFTSGPVAELDKLIKAHRAKISS